MPKKLSKTSQSVQYIPRVFKTHVFHPRTAPQWKMHKGWMKRVHSATLQHMIHVSLAFSLSLS